MMAGKSFVFRFADVEVREREFSLTKAGEAHAVEPKAFRVLLILLHNPGKLIPKQELLDAVWGDAAVTENSLARAVALLRKVLGDDARTPRFIETVATVGYRFLGTVEAVEDCSAPSTAPDPTSPVETAASPSTASARPSSAIQPPKHRSIRNFLFAAAAASVLLFAAAFSYLSRPLPRPRITAYTQLTHDGRNKQPVATDGSRLYFNQFSPALIAQIGVNGGEIAQLPIAIPGANIYLADISPDGANALIGSFEEDHPLNSQWVVPVLGGAAKRLGDGAGEMFSPDGSSVIYSAVSGDIYMIRTDGTGKQKLASVAIASAAGGLEWSRGFQWSPDGNIIRFSQQDGLWEMSKDGTGIHRLLPGWNEGPQCCGRWTQDGSLYLFLANGQIWGLDERRGLFRHPSRLPIQLTTGPISWGAPIPGKNAGKIFVDGANLRGELSRIDLKTGSPAPFLGGISAEFVSFSPDGKYVAYVAFPEGTLWKANRDGTNRVQFTRPPDQVVNPRWSPDSKEIVFTEVNPDHHVSIRRISEADGTPLWLLSEEKSDTHDACWSPDGTKVLYGMGPGQGFTTATQDLRIVDLKSRRVTTLPASGNRFSPRWSPDGRYILALFSNPPRNALPIFDVAAQQWHTLQLNGDAEFPTFSRDSRFISFLRYGRDQGIFRIPVAGGKEERIVNMTEWHLTGLFGYSMTLDPTGAPLVLRDTGSDDIYALTLER